MPTPKPQALCHPRKLPEIVRDVPISRAGGVNRYPFADMALGWSFKAAPGDGQDIQSLRCSIRNSAAKFSGAMKARGVVRRFVVRTVYERGQKVIRCWRVE